MKDILGEILHESLTTLHADRLPPWVTERLASDFGQKATAKLRRLAAREITIRKIARVFASGAGTDGGCRGETLVSSPAEQALSNEVRQGL